MIFIPKSEQNTSKWSGGETTEVTIYPENSNFQNRDFSFRISTATVEASPAEFTPLEGFRRTLMVLTGALTLKHEGQHQADLNAFDKDVFDGGWKTVSEGTCVDLNLMTGEGWDGDLMKYPFEDAAVFTITKSDFTGFFLVSGQAELECEADNVVKKLSAGDFVLLRKGETIMLEPKAASQLVVIQIQKSN